MNSLSFQDVFEPYYEGRDGLVANAARDETVHAPPVRNAARAERQSPTAPPTPEVSPKALRR